MGLFIVFCRIKKMIFVRGEEEYFCSYKCPCSNSVNRKDKGKKKKQTKKKTENAIFILKGDQHVVVFYHNTAI